MTEKPHASNSNNIEMNVTASGDSKVTQVGQINAAEVKIIVERLEQIPQLESPGVLKAGNPQKSLAYWQGRKTEIAQIQQWFNDQNTFLIGIEGIGGTGKSMLAAKIYEEIAGFPKRFWGDVSNGAGFSDLARQVLTEFGFRVPEQEVQLVDALVKCLRSGEFLLIIDNVESLLQPNRQWGSQFYSDFFNAWVESGGNSKVLVTTRERPELKGFEWLSLTGLQVDEGVALLTALGIRGELGEFVKLVDGHPLMLRLVADLLKEEYPQNPDLSRLADLGLGNLQQLLTDPQVVGVHRRENVGMVLVLDASFNRLNELQKALLLNISVYRGAVDSAAAAAVLRRSSKTKIERELKNLVQRSLLVEKLNDKRRFEFQPVVLEYVRYKAGNQTKAHQRAIDYYLSIAKERGFNKSQKFGSGFGYTKALKERDYVDYLIHDPKQPPWKTKDDVKEHLEIFYHWYQLENYDSAFDALNACNEFLSLRGYYTDQVELYGQLIAAWQKTDERENWKYRAALSLLGIAYYSLGEYQRAIEFHEQSLEIFREIGDSLEERLRQRNGEGNSLMNLGNAYNSLGQYQLGIEFQEQSLEIFREIGNRDGKGKSLNNLGVAYNSMGKYQRAIEFLQQSLEISREIGNRDGEGKSLNNLGIAYRSLGKYERAIEFFQQSLEISREIGNRNNESNSLNNLGIVDHSLGKYQRAIEFYQQSLEIFREIADRDGEGKSLNNLGIAYRSLGKYKRAIEFFQQSLEISREIGDRNNESKSLNNLGSAYDSLGEYQQAIEFYQESLEISREIGDMRGEAIAWFNLGLALKNVNREPDALGAYRNARELYQRIGIDVNVQLCNDAIERLSQPKTPVVSRHGFWGWLRRLWRWLRSWFRR